MPFIHIAAIDADQHGEGWTDYLHGRGAAKGINRQCSIGWHAECSDPEGDLPDKDEGCQCHCHPQSAWPDMHWPSGLPGSPVI